MPLIEQYPNYKFLQTSFRQGHIENLTKTFYNSKPVWNKRGEKTYFSECGWYKYPYCCFAPQYADLNNSDVIGLLQTEIYNAAVWQFGENFCAGTFLSQLSPHTELH